MMKPSLSATFYDLKDPIIVFDGENKKEMTPIEIGCRQPSFFQLNGDPILKGFGSLDDFKTKIDISCISDDKIECSEENDPALVEKKWEKIGYIPSKMPLSRNRQSTHPIFPIAEQLELQESQPNHCSSVLLTSKGFNLCPPSKPLEILSEESEFSDFLRSGSTGEALPKVEVPSDYESYIEEGQEETINLMSDGFPEQLHPFLTHKTSSLCYKIICGNRYPDIPTELLSIVADEIRVYIEIAFSNDFIAEANYLHDIVDEIRKLNSNNKKRVPYPDRVSPTVLQSKFRELLIEYEPRIDHWETQRFLADEHFKKELQNIKSHLKNQEIFENRYKSLCSQYERLTKRIAQEIEADLINVRTRVKQIHSGIVNNPFSKCNNKIQSSSGRDPPPQISRIQIGRKGNIKLNSIHVAASMSIRPSTQGQKKRQLQRLVK